MKKITLLLMPVMPGFDAWAVSGFIEQSDESDESKSKPNPIASAALTAIVRGFTTPASELVFIEYKKLGNVIEKFSKQAMHMAIQPLDRGGLLVSFEPYSVLWTRILAVIEKKNSAAVEPTLFESK